jgi:hypothetical protein
MADMKIKDVYISTNSLSFNSTELVQSTNVSILANEPYNIVNSTYYGNIYVINTDTSINKNYIIWTHK